MFPKIIIFALQQIKIFQNHPLSKIRIFWKNIHPCSNLSPRPITNVGLIWINLGSHEKPWVTMRNPEESLLTIGNLGNLTYIRCVASVQPFFARIVSCTCSQFSSSLCLYKSQSFPELPYITCLTMFQNLSH